MRSVAAHSPGGLVWLMHTLADLTRALNRSTVYLSGLQSRFELPTFDGAGYSEAYLAFLQSVVHLRTLSITEETLRDLWHIEKKLLVLLHADSTGSPTWFLDSCGATTSPKRQLLLTNYDMGEEMHGKDLQLCYFNISATRSARNGSETTKSAPSPRTTSTTTTTRRLGGASPRSLKTSRQSVTKNEPLNCIHER